MLRCVTPGKTQSLDVFQFSTFVFVPLSVWSMCSQPLPCLPITVGLFVLPAASYSAIKPKCFGNTAEHSAVSLWPPTSAPPLSSHLARIALLPLEMELVHEINLVSTPLLVWMRNVFTNLQAAYLNIQQATLALIFSSLFFSFALERGWPTFICNGWLEIALTSRRLYPDWTIILCWPIITLLLSYNSPA